MTDFGRRGLLLAAVVGATVGVDRWTKGWATRELSAHGRFSYWGDTFRLEYVHNRGAFLSLGATLPEPWRSILFTWGVGVFLMALVLGLAIRAGRPDHPVRSMVGYALVLGGGLSNLWDRATEGAVIDFLNLGVGSLRTGIFNIADVAIVAGVALVAWVKAPPAAVEAPPPG